MAPNFAGKDKGHDGATGSRPTGRDAAKLLAIATAAAYHVS